MKQEEQVIKIEMAVAPGNFAASLWYSETRCRFFLTLGWKEGIQAVSQELANGHWRLVRDEYAPADCIPPIIAHHLVWVHDPDAPAMLSEQLSLLQQLVSGGAQ